MEYMNHPPSHRYPELISYLKQKYGKSTGKVRAAVRTRIGIVDPSKAQRHDTGTTKATTTPTGTFGLLCPFGPFFRHAPSASVRESKANPGPIENDSEYAPIWTG